MKCKIQVQQKQRFNSGHSAKFTGFYTASLLTKPISGHGFSFLARSKSSTSPLVTKIENLDSGYDKIFKVKVI